MFRNLVTRKKSLAEKTLEAMEKRRAHMTPNQIARAEATFERITEEVRASRAAADGTRLTGTQVHQRVRSS